MLISVDVGLGNRRTKRGLEVIKIAAFVSLQNVDMKGKKKLLAKARVNLSDYYVAASVSPVAFKLKLFPEVAKLEVQYWLQGSQLVTQ